MRVSQANLLMLCGFSVTGDCGGFTFYTDKRRNKVAFPKSPPDKPPSRLQTHRRNQFRAIADCWNNLLAEVRSEWALAAARAHLSITGYNLFVYAFWKKDWTVVHTIEHQTGITLLPT